MSTYVLAVRRYFDKVNGNSYFSMRIMGEGVDIICPMEYGHSDLTYKARACKELGFDFVASAYGVEQPAIFTIDETVVTRQKDLHKKGNN